MAYLILAISLFLAVLLIRTAWSTGKQISAIVAVLAVALVGILWLDGVFDGNDGLLGASKGSDDERVLTGVWLEVFLYLMMVAGMVSKYFYDLFDPDKAGSFNVRKFMRPLLVSPMVFGVIYTATAEQVVGSMLLWVFAFQNGFFWQTVLDRSGKPQ